MNFDKKIITNLFLFLPAADGSFVLLVSHCALALLAADFLLGKASPFDLE
jgi:hypothetical protein